MSSRRLRRRTGCRAPAIDEEAPMPTRDEAPNGAPCGVELFTSDPDRTRAFYGELFGWTSESAGEEYGGYVTFARDGVAVAGCLRNDGAAGRPDVWTTYLATADADATVAAAAAHGAQVHLPVMDVMELGRMALIA